MMVIRPAWKAGGHSLGRGSIPPASSMKILVLDDDDNRHEVIGKMLKRRGHETVHVRSYNEAIKVLRNDVFEGMYLDHDLQEYAHGTRVERTGAHVVSFMVTDMDPKKLPKEVVIHSWNTDGSKVMENLLRSVGVAVKRQPFSALWI